MELNREQIVKALECCHSSNVADCKQCTYRGKADGEEDLGITCLNLLVRDALSLIKELTEENERLRAKNKALVNENAELKNQIQEEISEEDIDLYDEFTKLLHDEIRYAKANNLSEIKTRFAMRYGTYTDKDMTPITEVFRLLNQIAKELEGEE